MYQINFDELSEFALLLLRDQIRKLRNLLQQFGEFDDDRTEASFMGLLNQIETDIYEELCNRNYFDEIPF